MKDSYFITYVGSQNETYTNPNGFTKTEQINLFRINCRIVLFNLAGLPPIQMEAYRSYIETEIRNTWSSSTNPGLSRGNGRIVYNSSNDRITCFPPNVPAFAQDTGVIVQVANFNDWQIHDFKRTTTYIPPAGEIYFDVFANNPGRGQRDNFNLSTGMGNLYVRDSLNAITALNPTLAVNSPATQNIYLIASHEFGHALGLNDRYHFSAYANASNSTYEESNDNYLAISNDIPMYLPGVYDPSEEAAFTTLPRYNQIPYNLPQYQAPRYDAGVLRLLFSPDVEPMATPTNTVQPNYNEVNKVYDIEYNSGFTWLHNLMCSRTPVNNPFSTEAFRQNNTPSSRLYTALYQADFANPLTVVPITKVQLDVILNLTNRTLINLDNGVTQLNQTMRYKPFRSELEMVTARGFRRHIFDQYMFFIQGSSVGAVDDIPQILGDNNPVHKNPWSDATGTASGTIARRSFSYNLVNGVINTRKGTFVGIVYKKRLKSDGANGEMVSDYGFFSNGLNDHDLQYPGTDIGLLGIHDMMDYRMSQVAKSTFTNQKLIQFKLNNQKEETDQNGLIGFFNPNLTGSNKRWSQGLDRILREFFTSSSSRIPFRNNPSIDLYLSTCINLNKFLIEKIKDEVLKADNILQDMGIGNEIGRILWNTKCTKQDLFRFYIQNSAIGQRYQSAQGTGPFNLRLQGPLQEFEVPFYIHRFVLINSIISG